VRQDGLHGVRADRCGRAAGPVAAHEPAALVDASSHSSERAIIYTILVGICFFAGYFLADWIRGPRVRPIEVVCSHVDYLYEHADEVTSSQRWRRELSQLKDECDAVPGR
jgi:hypothetical protein